MLSNKVEHLFRAAIAMCIIFCLLIAAFPGDEFPSRSNPEPRGVLEFACNAEFAIRKARSELPANSRELAAIEAKYAESLPVLYELLQHEDTEVRVASARALGIIPVEKVGSANALAKALAHFSTKAELIAALDSLGRLNVLASVVVEQVSSHLNNAEPTVRASCCWVLRGQSNLGEPILERIRQRLDDQDRKVRDTALGTFVIHSDVPSPLTALRPWLDSKIADDRLLAVSLLLLRRGEPGVDRILSEIKRSDPDPFVRSRID